LDFLVSKEAVMARLVIQAIVRKQYGPNAGQRTFKYVVEEGEGGSGIA
jgi:hypothetical protein